MGLTRIRAQQISDIDYKQAVRVITLSDITLSGGAPAEVDGVTLQAGNRILVNGQDDAAQNGLYVVQTAGTGSNGTWVRTADANQDGEILPGMVVMVTEGTVYADTPWKLITNGDIIVGTTELTFAENYSLAFGNVFANGTAVVANTVSAPITFEAGTNVTIVGNNITKTVTFSATGGGGGGTPGGADTQVQFNDSGSFGGSAGFIFDKTTNAVSTTGTVTAIGNIAGGNLSGTLITGTLTTAAQTNITSLGTLDSLTVTGNVSSGNLTTTGQITATGNVLGGNLIVTNNIIDTGALEIITASNGNITLSPNGSGVIVASKDIRNGQANGTGNIGASGAVFNTVFAKATSAQYADLAEQYLADQSYEPGTVVEIGGSAEITQTSSFASTSIAGVISTDPAFIMNSGISGDHVVAVALLGRVPCRVAGQIRRGDLLCSSTIAGHAVSMPAEQYRPGSVIGKALEDHHNDGAGMIEILAGRL